MLYIEENLIAIAQCSMNVAIIDGIVCSQLNCIYSVVYAKVTDVYEATARKMYDMI